ncbi:MAG TPA: peptidoglycan-binding protein [Acidimicrobiia bacterium]|nr:peptidoglycan-binding protein [Acidimicrobiia bacterium]
MALYSKGDTGEAVRDIQDRLIALGFDVSGDGRGEFGDSTRLAVISFQESRRIAADGMVGRETWRTLVDAGFALGDRLLYYRMPMLHGDDVAELQRRLNAIGFDAGDVDGIFGPATLSAVLDFQHNRIMAEDGIVGPAVVAELGLMARETGKMGRHEVRERVWLSSLPQSITGQRVFVDPFCRDDREAIESWAAAMGAMYHLREAGAHPMLSRSEDTRPAERLRADHANEVAADIVLGISLPSTDVAGVYYFASSMSHSEAGARIAGAVAAGLGVEAVGRLTPLLRETRAPAIVVALPRLDETVGVAVARSIEEWMAARTVE